VIGTDLAKTIEGQVSALTNAHASVPEEQEGVAIAIIAPQQLVLDQAILVDCQWARQIVVLAGCVLPKD
jgi:hypothetical protein